MDNVTEQRERQQIVEQLSSRKREEDKAAEILAIDKRFLNMQYLSSETRMWTSSTETTLMPLVALFVIIPEIFQRLGFLKDQCDNDPDSCVNAVFYNWRFVLNSVSSAISIFTLSYQKTKYFFSLSHFAELECLRKQYKVVFIQSLLQCIARVIAILIAGFAYSMNMPFGYALFPTVDVILVVLLIQFPLFLVYCVAVTWLQHKEPVQWKKSFRRAARYSFNSITVFHFAHDDEERTIYWEKKEENPQFQSQDQSNTTMPMSRKSTESDNQTSTNANYSQHQPTGTGRATILTPRKINPFGSLAFIFPTRVAWSAITILLSATVFSISDENLHKGAIFGVVCGLSVMDLNVCLVRDIFMDPWEKLANRKAWLYPFLAWTGVMLYITYVK